MTSVSPSDLDRRIIGCLQYDGRASWRRIAAALRESERTVARRGALLLQSRTVVVTGLSVRGDSFLVRGSCAPGTARMAARSLAVRGDVTFSYIVTGEADCVAEVITTPERFAPLLLDELPATPGMVGCTSHSVLRYYRTVHEWHPDLVTEEEVARLGPFPHVTPSPTVDEPDGFDEVDRKMSDALGRDGRATNDELARITGVSEATVRRRLDALRRQGLLLIRAVVEPAVVGLPVEAVLWIRTAPQHVDDVGLALLGYPEVRYAAAVMGEHQVVAHVATRSKDALHGFISRGAWQEHAVGVDTSLVVQPLKRSGVLATTEGG